MLKSRRQFLIWRRQVFVRNPNVDLNTLYSGLDQSVGIYLIGCADEIVYIGQACNLHERPFESLGRAYHRVSDTSLPWSLALAPCRPEEMDERESTAIRTYAPRFNTSIPSKQKSRGRMPEVIGIAAVFQDQDERGGAFNAENLKRQMERARANPSPPWRQRKRRKKTQKREKKPDRKHIIAPVVWSDDDRKGLFQHYGVPLNGSLNYKINLCDDGSVVTRDGEYIGTWTMDENEHPSFTPDGDVNPLLYDNWVGLLCAKIREWHESETGEIIA